MVTWARSTEEYKVYPARMIWWRRSLSYGLYASNFISKVHLEKKSQENWSTAMKPWIPNQIPRKPRIPNPKLLMDGRANPLEFVLDGTIRKISVKIQCPNVGLGCD